MPATDFFRNRSIPPSPLRALCVSIHDVAPHTWSRCQHWLQAIHAVADIPVTLLVVPKYHHHKTYHQAQFDRLLENRMSSGDELALHGYSHLDEASMPTTLWSKFVRNVYTQREAEFYAIDADEARRRLQRGIEWFNRNQWPITGFVAPAWLLGKGSWQALRESPFKYTTTMRRFHILPERETIHTPSLVYSARNAWLKRVSLARNSIIYNSYQLAPVLRIGLHPNDVLHPDIVKNTQQLIAKFLADRTAMTKIGFTSLWQQRTQSANQTLSTDDSFMPVYCRDSHNIANQP